jgi:hypothetical protein
MTLRRSHGLGTMGRIGVAAIVMLAPISIVRAQTTDPVRAELTSSAPETPFGSGSVWVGTGHGPHGRHGSESVYRPADAWPEPSALRAVVSGTVPVVHGKRTHDSPFTIRGGAPARAWKVDGGGRLVWNAAEPMRLEVASPTSQGGGPRARNRSKGYKTAQRFLAGVSLGVLGFFGGGLAGAAIDGVANSGGESPGLAGFMIGAPIGAAVGATIGVMITR